MLSRPSHIDRFDPEQKRLATDFKSCGSCRYFHLQIPLGFFHRKSLPHVTKIQCVPWRGLWEIRTCGTFFWGATQVDNLQFSCSMSSWFSQCQWCPHWCHPNARTMHPHSLWWLLRFGIKPCCSGSPGCSCLMASHQYAVIQLLAIGFKSNKLKPTIESV